MLLFLNLSIPCLSEIYTVDMEKNWQENRKIPSACVVTKIQKNLSLNTIVVLDTHVNEINKHNCTLANKLYNKF